MNKTKKDFKKKHFKDWKSWQLAIMGSISALGSAFIVYFLGRTWPLYVQAVETSEAFSWLGLYVSIQLVWISLLGIVFTAICKRCGQLLYQRLLD